ncbi:EamA/RhaT family transporter [Hanstruepera flava]|uniref:EamA/RhaT family transporter n=1 Tax=Hanstruepera flava TaxID=2930218 RepID=UPI00202883AA|nr:EamA/RhaT family transporter [Hanstruepera flava]
MIYLLFSILSSTAIFVLFKLFDRYQINTLQAIVVNYVTASIMGFSLSSKPFNVSETIQSEWFLGAIALGMLFISIFNIMAIVSQRNGLSVASVATKMSVVIPVIFGIYVYGESTGLQKLFGILLALVAVVLVSVKPRSNFQLKNKFLLPFLLFLGSGIIDTSIKYIETYYIEDNGIPLFSATIFCFAAINGFSVLIYKKLKGELKFNKLSLVGGFVLGIVNYASIYYLLKALDHESLESSTIFTVNNVAIVMLSGLIGFILFKEKLSIKNWLGVVVAILSILLVTLA